MKRRNQLELFPHRAVRLIGLFVGHLQHYASMSKHSGHAVGSESFDSSIRPNAAQNTCKSFLHILSFVVLDLTTNALHQEDSVFKMYTAAETENNMFFVLSW
jgi:hypothetical protein